MFKVWFKGLAHFFNMGYLLEIIKCKITLLVVQNMYIVRVRLGALMNLRGYTCTSLTKEGFPNQAEQRSC